MSDTVVKNSFIASTARDYDMSYEEVLRIHNLNNGDSAAFYRALEDYIKQRSSK